MIIKIKIKGTITNIIGIRVPYLVLVKTSSPRIFRSRRDIFFRDNYVFSLASKIKIKAQIKTVVEVDENKKTNAWTHLTN